MGAQGMQAREGARGMHAREGAGNANAGPSGKGVRDHAFWSQLKLPF